MKLCIADPLGNLGGGGRFLRCLVPALLARRPELRVTLLAPRAVFAREDWSALADHPGLELRELRATRFAQEGLPGFSASAPAVRYAQGRFARALRPFPARLRGDAAAEIQRAARRADLAFFPWPYLLAPPALHCPSVAVFHDFNYRYNFGGFPSLLPWQVERVRRELPLWAERAHPVVTSRFMAGEFARFLPGAPRAPELIRVPPMLPPVADPGESAAAVLARLGLTPPFVLYPCNLHTHKNLGPLLAALARLRAEGRSLSLVLTGPYTEGLRGRACAEGVALDESPADVHGLGYLPAATLERLLESAAVVVSSSLYEAGSGPGLEGWAKGRPVALSDIPSFTEQVAELGVHAAFFDPRSPESIARALAGILDDPAGWRERAEASRARLRECTWEQAAESYLRLFDRLRTAPPP
jgi:glycosyltransferase involved in cell wall biosynthesis